MYLSKKTDLWLMAAMLVAMTVIFTLMSAWTPLRLDDNVFLYIYRGFNDGSDDFSWRALYDSWANNRLHDNARLSNFCSPISTVTEPWCTLFPFISGIVCTAMVWFTAKLMGIRRNRAVALAIAWIAVIVLVQWRNSLFVRDYLLNYPYSAILYFAFVSALCADEGRRLRKPLWFVGTTLCGILLGGWHEGFAIPAACGMGVWALKHRFKLPWQWWVVGVCLGVSTLGFLYCPGMLKRIYLQAGKSGEQNLLKDCVDSALPIITLLVLVGGMWRKSWRIFLTERLQGQLMTIITTSMIISLIMSYMVMHTPRMSMLPTLCAIIVWGRIVGGWIERMRRSGAIAIVCACALLCTAQGVAACVWQYRLKKEYDKVTRAMIESPTGTAFYDVYMPKDMPLYTLLFPSRDQWVHGWSFYTFDLSQGCDPDRGCNRQHSVVPTALKHPKGSLISDEGKCYTDGQNIWCANNPAIKTKDYTSVHMTLRDGTQYPHIISLIERFISLDGDTLIYIYPYNNVDARELTDIGLN